jgi:hypothetical protein
MSLTVLLSLALVAFLGLALGAAAFGRYVEVRRRRRRRVVEQPNSHHTWDRVRAIEVRERWHDIPLERIHEVNRDEVTRLLARVSALGADALRPQERVFLDNMASIAGIGPQPPSRTVRPDKGGAAAPDLRHRPA